MEIVVFVGNAGFFAIFLRFFSGFVVVIHWECCYNEWLFEEKKRKGKVVQSE